MKIRTLLTIQGAILAAIIFAVTFVIIFLISVRYTRVEFFERLKYHATLTIDLYLELDEEGSGRGQPIRKYPSTVLVDQAIRIFENDTLTNLIEQGPADDFTMDIVREVNKNGELETKVGDRQLYGVSYKDEDGNFVILVSAFDKYGIAKIRNQAKVLFISYFALLVIFSFGTSLFAKRALSPIRRIVNEVKIIQSSKLHLRLDEGNGKDELAELSKTFNEVLNKLEDSFNAEKSFVNNAAHELRTPLTAILGEVEVTLSRKRSEEEYEEVLNSVHSEATRLTLLLNNLLDLAKLNASQLDMTSETLRLDEVLFHCIELARTKYPDSPLHVEIGELPENFEELIIQGQNRLLSLAFSNLIENACKYSDGKEVVVRLEEKNGSILISINDKGIGISPEEMKRIFQPFYRAENARGYFGTGLGLSLAEKIVKIHRGKLELLSKAGKGTTVTIEFSQASVEREVF